MTSTDAQNVCGRVPYVSCMAGTEVLTWIDNSTFNWLVSKTDTGRTQSYSNEYPNWSLETSITTTGYSQKLKPDTFIMFRVAVLPVSEELFMQSLDVLKKVYKCCIKVTEKSRKTLEIMTQVVLIFSFQAFSGTGF